MFPHIQVVGSPGTGKNETVIRAIAFHLKESKWGGMYVGDFHQDMARKLIPLCYELGIPVVLDCDRSDLVVPRNVYPVTGDDFATQQKRHKLNQQLLECFGRGQGRKGIHQNPTIERSGIILLESWNRNPNVPLGRLHRALRNDTPEFEAIETQELAELVFLPPRDRDFQVGALERMWQRLSPDVVSRLVPGPDIWDFIAMGGVFINATQEPFLYGLDLLNAQFLAKQGKFKDWTVKLYLDEASKYITEHEADGAEEMRKFDLQYFFLDQTGEYGEYSQRIWNACATKVFTGCGDPDLAQYWARMIRSSNYDPQEVDYKEKRYRTVPSTRVERVHGGWDIKTKEQMWRNQYVNDSYQERYDVEHYRSFNDQVHMDAKKILNLPLNKMILARGPSVTEETVEPYIPNPELEELAWQWANFWTQQNGITPSSEPATTPARWKSSKQKSKSSRTIKSQQEEWHD